MNWEILRKNNPVKKIRFAQRPILTQKELAHFVGCNPGTVSFWENNCFSLPHRFSDYGEKLRQIGKERGIAEATFDEYENMFAEWRHGIRREKYHQPAEQGTATDRLPRVCFP